MADVAQLETNPISGFNTDNIKWMRLKSDEFDYPIDYWIAILGHNAQQGRVDFLGKWEPNAYCHYHRHLGETTTLVLEGEHHVVEINDTETIHKTRKPGHYAKNPAGDLHMEYAGPEGSVVLFSMKTNDERLFEILDRDDNVIAIASLDDFVSGAFAS